ncbi:M20/M25/M40 family metallo-hydrolase [Acidipila rosea]|uniref:Acetylornithine deacetylase/succinyl-diaminopimelate desuccinylase-like protein n=1 Tax=Acidipila rosea TaxID=768535 RepID=A0A4R1L993_9BACT|nr:M20/M25/M40 family metallo-hydrolase [Acidipila rosea]TCK73543.1 acetylornithine deacetylase/succinyl-diaminopimelate desuccinylase-like protein [Acidipila rosea]
MQKRFAALCLSVSFIALSSAPSLRAQVDDKTRQLSHDIFKQLIEINTTDSVGSVTAASEAMAKRLLDAGFSQSDVQVLGPNDRKKNMVARLHGSGKGPTVLFIGHLDVVEARREDWTTDPFKFVEKDGYYYGRGTQDMKEADAILVTTFIRMKQAGFVPDGDLILALTADEEGGKSNGVDWLIRNHPELVKADFAINPDAGGVDTEHGKVIAVDVEATEKLYADYQLLTTNPGGHSSLPVPDNAIYHIADALTKLQNYNFPFELNEVTRAFFKKMSTIETGQKAADMNAILSTPPNEEAIKRLAVNPVYNSTMRTTCVATRLLAGHANNALPGMAQANVNCRILPGHSREEVRQALIHLFDDPKVTVNYVNDAGTVFNKAPDAVALPPVPLKAEVMKPLEKTVEAMWPGALVVPEMEPGASDSIYTNGAGIPTYGISGIAIDVGDIRAHGRDERVPVASFYQGVDFYYRFVTALAKSK